MSARVYVYVDGFNLYYRALRGKLGVKWLDIRALAQGLLRPGDSVEKVRYFTARISGRADPDGPRRQHIYLSALRHHPEYSLHFGKFFSKAVWRPLAEPPDSGSRFVRVLHSEEKGSDVNLAVHLLNDAWKSAYDMAAVITNDTDLVEPIRLVTRELKKPVVLLCPAPNAAPALRAAASLVRHIRKRHLVSAQFPDPIPDTMLHKPESW